MRSQINKILVIANILLLICIIFLLLGPKKNTSSLKVTVDPKIQKMAENIVLTCGPSSDKETCYAESLEQVVKEKDFSFTEKTLYAMQDFDPTTKSCHVLAHYIGRFAVEKDPDNWLTLFDSVNVNACGSGFLHGVLEAHFGDDYGTEFNGELSDKVCNRGNDDMRKRMCTHLMGHFFIVENNDNVPIAVNLCKQVSEKLQFDCFDGLFMEHNQRIALEDHGILPLPVYGDTYAKSVEKVCKKYSGKIAEACSTELAEVYAKSYGYNADVIYKHCKIGAGEKYLENCYGKGITILATYPLKLEPQKMVDICKFYETENEYKGCLNNALSSLLSYSPKFTERALLLCENIPNYNDWCLINLGSRLEKIVPSIEDRKTFCQSASNKRNKNLCAKIQ